MHSDNVEQKRLLLELSKIQRLINREVINPTIPEVGINDLKPVIELVAKVRAEYLGELFDVSEAAKDNLPTVDQIKKLRTLRAMYEELVAAYKALEHAIEVGYLDVIRTSK